MSNKNIPDRLYIRKCYEEDFDKLKDELNLQTKEIFFMSMALGFLNNSCEELDSKEEFVLGAWIKDNDECLMNAIAVCKEGNLGVLLDKKKVYSIAEQYASGGIKYLKNDVIKEQFGSYIKLLEGQLVEEYKKINFDK